MGWIETGKAVLRSGAKVGDYVCVSGQIGDAAYGLQHLDIPYNKDWTIRRHVVSLEKS